MANKKFCLGILVLVLVFGLIVFGCDIPEEEESGAGTFNGVWYGVNEGYYGGSWEKTGTVITVSNGTGILTSVGDDLYGNYVNQGLINIGDPVFRNVVYLESNYDTYFYSYEVWAKWDDDKADELPAWHNDCKLYIYKYRGKEGKNLSLNLSDRGGVGIFYVCIN